MPEEKAPSGRSDFRHRLLRGLVFGVPGGVAFIYLGVVLVLYFATGEVRPSIVLLLAGALFLSALCAAHGMGDWRQALYVVSLLVWGGAFLGAGYLLGPTDTKGLLSGLVAVVPALVAHYAIQRYLARRQRQEAQGMPHSRRLLTLGPSDEPLWVRLYVRQIGDTWAAMIVADGVLPPEPEELRGTVFFGATARQHRSLSCRS